MNTSFTPGPWTLGKGKVTIREASKPGREGFVARCHMPGEYRVRSEEEAEANARLIAASPDLLLALIELHEYTRTAYSGYRNALTQAEDELYLQVRTAINLATQAP